MRAVLISCCVVTLVSCGVAIGNAALLWRRGEWAARTFATFTLAMFGLIAVAVAATVL